MQPAACDTEAVGQSKACLTKPYTPFPIYHFCRIPLFSHFLHSPHSASRAVLRARVWFWTAQDVALGTSWRVRPFTLPKHAFGDQGPCWACMTGLRMARVPVPARGGCFDPLQKVSANPYFNHTTFPPLFSLLALGAQGPCWHARLAFGWRRCPSWRTLAVSAPLQKVSTTRYFNSTSFPPLISLRSRRSVGPCWGW